jgi:hypothetical protein
MKFLIKTNSPTETLITHSREHCKLLASAFDYSSEKLND